MDAHHPKYVYRLQKALYGLNQDLHAWHDKIVDYLITIGFCMANVDHSLQVLKANVDIVIITIYVDNLIVGSRIARERRVTEGSPGLGHQSDGPINR